MINKTKRKYGLHLTHINKFQGKQKPDRKIISVEMKLAILLLSLPVLSALGYLQNYKGFENCGVNGWHCGYTENGKYEITYTCPYGQSGARVWIWTARLPTGSSIFTVRNCLHLEVHMDCTEGLRTKILSEFRVYNVKLLEFLRPILPGVFLHDNDNEPQAPPALYIENVEETDFYPGMFDKPGGSCRYKQVEISTLSLKNIRKLKLRKDLFRNQYLENLIIKNVQIKSMEYNSLVINGNVSILESTFPKLSGNTISLKGKTILFDGNTFEKISNSALNAHSSIFQFSNNTVEEIGSQGLNVMASHVSIINNSFNHLDPGAFQEITPGYSPNTYEVASRLTFNFSDNKINNISPGSLDPNWEAYRKVCSQIIFKNNIFDCSCLNLGWMSVSNGLGPKLSKAKEFYDLYIKTEGNICKGYDYCPLNTIVPLIQDVCNNKTNISEICTTLQGSTDFETTSLIQDWTAPNSTEEEQTSLPINTEKNEVTEKIIPALSYTENQALFKEERTIPIWHIVLPVVVVLAAIFLGVFIWWYKRKKERQIITTVYKNEKGGDADNLLVLNEHHNELYDKQ